MVELSGLTDQQLADRYARVDAKIRGIKQHSPLTEKLEELMWEIREELDRRRTEGVSNEEIKRSVEYAQQQFAAYSARLQAERERSRSMFPSTLPNDRGAVSPLGNVSPEWEWSGRKS
jgi:hypothetical protein